MVMSLTKLLAILICISAEWNENWWINMDERTDKHKIVGINQNDSF